MAAIQRRARGDQHQRIEIALNGDGGSARARGSTTARPPVDADGIDAGGIDIGRQ